MITGHANVKLLDALAADRLISPHEQRALLQLAEGQGWSIPDALERTGLVAGHQLETLFDRLSLYPPVDLDNTTPSADALELLDAGFAWRYRALPLALRSEDVLSIASCEPEDIAARDAIQAALPLLQLRWLKCTASALERALTHHYPTSDRLQQLIDSDSPDAVAIVDQVLADAMVHGASDFHLQPERGFARIRLRFDGVLESVALVAASLFSSLSVRLKVLAELDIADTRVPQDGRFYRSICARDCHFRVSVLPTENGEAIVVRLLPADRRAPSLGDLFDPSARQLLGSLLEHQEGLLLMAGPTGSGKTTTLHGLLERLRSPSRCILTLEDPVEYTAPWLRQTSVNPDGGIGYADGIRAALRQDPDVMLIGEIRDSESARIALQAAMTGHRVLSTVHANSAVAALPRLLELGLSTRLLANHLIGIVSQRLLRKLCIKCKPGTPPPHTDGVGCTLCMGRGYRGRFAAVEILRITVDVAQIVDSNGPRSVLVAEARNSGYVPMAESAWQSVCDGLTSLSEYKRVIGALPTGCSDG